ncbi:MAG: hypothetical protein ACLPID_00455 [Beijerinckiaceae bacterium]
MTDVALPPRAAPWSQHSPITLGALIWLATLFALVWGMATTATVRERCDRAKLFGFAEAGGGYTGFGQGPFYSGTAVNLPNQCP